MHQVDRMMYAGKVPWHGLGIKGQEFFTADDVRATVFPWIVLERSVLALGNGSETAPADDYKALVRSDSGRVLAVVPRTYGVVQYGDALGVLEAAAEAGNVKIVSAGTLRDGKRAWALASIPSAEFEIAGSAVKPYLLMATSHDGTLAIRYTFTGVYVVCNNTLTAAIRGAGDTIAIRHTINAAQRVDAATRLVQQARDFFGAFNDLALSLVRQRIGAVEVKDVARELFPYVDFQKGGVSSAVNADAVAKIVTLFVGGQRASSNAPGTKWSAFNAITEYLDHHVNRRNAESRFEAALYGAGAVTRRKALDLLVAA